jgi:chitosanase
MFIQLPPIPPTDTLPAVVQKLTSLFENSSIEPDYTYIEYLDDGRGFTFGKVGFTTGTGDGFDIIREYTDSVKDSKLVNYLDELKRLAKKESGDTSDLVGFADAWKNEAEKTKYFQDKVAFDLYGRPALEYCNLLGLKSTLAIAIIYDAIVQHGNGKDKDGIRKIFKKTINELGGTPSGRTHKDNSCDELPNSEIEFLNIFLAKRKEILEDSHDKDSREVWAESTGRVDVFKKLLDDKNLNLQMPLQITSPEWNAIIK